MLLVVSEKGKGMQSSSEQPLVGEEHCVTNRITAAKETNCLIARQGADLSVYTFLKCPFLLETVREKDSYISDPILHLMPVATNFSTICS